MVSLDGSFAGPRGEFDWPLVDEGFNQFAMDQLDSVDAILFGRVTYQGMASYWPTAVTSPSGTLKSDSGVVFAVSTSASDLHTRMAYKMNTLPKIVFSKTLKKADWNNSRLVREVLPGEIMKMRQQPGKDMVIFGSADLVSTFTNHGLIDEYRLFVNPIVLGDGKPLFKDVSERQKLKLVNTKPFTTGVVGLFYQKSKE